MQNRTCSRLIELEMMNKKQNSTDNSTEKNGLEFSNALRELKPFHCKYIFSQDKVQLAEAAVFLPAYLGSSAGAEL